MQTKHFTGYSVRTAVATGKSAVSKVSAGSSYQHTVETTKYYQLYAIDLTVTSKLNDNRQLKFQHGQSWSVSLHLDPLNAASPGVEGLDCIFPKQRTLDSIFVDISGGDTGKIQIDLAIV